MELFLFVAFLLTQKTILLLLLYPGEVTTEFFQIVYERHMFQNTLDYANFIQIQEARKLDICYFLQAFPCDCVHPRCAILGTCCSACSVDDIANPVDSDKVTTWTEEQRPETRCLSLPKPSHKHAMACIGQCHPDFQEEVTIQKCNNPAPPISLENYTPVEDEESHLIFCNKFCAECNYIDKVSEY